MRSFVSLRMTSQKSEIFDTLKTNLKMVLFIMRRKFTRWGTTGELWIGGEKVCDTVEHPMRMLAPGRYEMQLEHNERYGMRCLTVKGEPYTALVLKGEPYTALVPANGPFGLGDSCSIAVGTWLMTGVLTKCKETATAIKERVRKNKGRAVLEII